jgi:hypothetical protein
MVKVIGLRTGDFYCVITSRNKLDQTKEALRFRGTGILHLLRLLRVCAGV